MTTGRTTLVQLDLSDAADGPDASINTGMPAETAVRARKKRAQEETPPAPSRQKCNGEPTKSLPVRTTSLIPFPISEAGEDRELTQLNTRIRSTFEAKAKRINEAGQALAELEGLVSGKVREWEKAGLVEALGLGTEINYVMNRHCKNFDSSNKSSAVSDVTNTSKENTKSWVHITASSSNCEAPKAKETKTSKASPTIQQKLRANRGVQVVPSRLAITTEDFISPANNLDLKGKIAASFEEAKVESEQKRAVFIIPDSPRSYRTYEGGQRQITEQKAKEEFKYSPINTLLGKSARTEGH